MCHNKCAKVYSIVTLLIATILGILACSMPAASFGVEVLVTLSHFFEIFIPVLAAAALIKYICCAKGNHCHTDNNSCNN